MEQIDLPKKIKDGALYISKGFEDDNRYSCHLEPIYKYGKTGILEISLSDKECKEYFKIASTIIVGLNDNTLIKLFITDLKISSR